MLFLLNRMLNICARMRTFCIPSSSSSCSFPLLLPPALPAAFCLLLHRSLHACQPSLHLTHVLAECRCLASLVCWWVSPPRGWQLHLGLSALPGKCNVFLIAMVPRLKWEKAKLGSYSRVRDLSAPSSCQTPLPCHQKSEASQDRDPKTPH